MASRLIINADDFGLTPGINRAIAQLHEAGALTSTTLMATGSAFDDAVAIAHAHPKLEVHRPSVGKPLLYPDDAHIVGIACDDAALTAPLPVLPLDAVAAIADFILSESGLAHGATER